MAGTPPPAPHTEEANTAQATIDEANAVQPHIEADPEYDHDSVLDERLSAYTASLTSSVLNYPMEHGRRYHAFRPGAYLMPNDEKEMDRLELTHYMNFLALGKKHYLAPIDEAKTHRVLDLGTGTGIWAIDMGDILPGAEIIGNDLSAIQPSWVPPNVKFEVDDIESEWTHSTPFDFIHCRYLIGAINDWPKLVGQIYDNLRPGGWAELNNYDCMIYADDGTMPKDSATHRWAVDNLALIDSTGKISSPGPHLEKWAREAGFVNIAVTKIKVPIGPWPKDPALKEIGKCNLIMTTEGLEAFSLKVLCGLGGWSEVEATLLLAKVREEMKKGEMHQLYDMYVVVGQKPE